VDLLYVSSYAGEFLLYQGVHRDRVMDRLRVSVKIKNYSWDAHTSSPRPLWYIGLTLHTGIDGEKENGYPYNIHHLPFYMPVLYSGKTARYANVIFSLHGLK